MVYLSGQSMAEPGLGRFVVGPENRPAFEAVRRVVTALAVGQVSDDLNPLLLQGPTGSGKSHLVHYLVVELAERSPTCCIYRLGNAERVDSQLPPVEELAGYDLIIGEDIHQRLRERVGREWLLQIIDRGRARRQQLVFTSLTPSGPQFLPVRLATRLHQGLSVVVAPLDVSRVRVLAELARRRQLAVPQSVLTWLTPSLPSSGRGLEAVAVRLESLVQEHGYPLTVERLAEHWQPCKVSDLDRMAHITAQVAAYFQVSARSLRSARRSRRLLLPRQLGMYLARRQTRLSLQQIGEFFGNRDHTTVLHACRKIERETQRDVAVAGAVRELGLPTPVGEPSSLRGE